MVTLAEMCFCKPLTGIQTFTAKILKDKVVGKKKNKSVMRKWHFHLPSYHHHKSYQHISLVFVAMLHQQQLQSRHLLVSNTEGCGLLVCLENCINLCKIHSWLAVTEKHSHFKCLATEQDECLIFTEGKVVRNFIKTKEPEQNRLLQELDSTGSQPFN